MRILCVLSLLVSAVALVVSLFRNSTYDVDYPSLLVSVLSAIVIILIGWQVVDYFLLKRNIGEMIDGRLAALTSDYQVVLRGVVSLNLHGHYLKGECALLTDCCFESLLCISECKDARLSRFAVNAVMEVLHELCDHYEGNYCIYAGKKCLYLHILSNIDVSNKERIESILNSANEVPDTDSKIDFAEALSGDQIDALCPLQA